jgi:pyruvate/2-oxoglutarate/acetoin dehydrogenase E1 component
MSTMVQAIRMALHVAEERHSVTDIFGEDVGPPLGGAFTATQGLKTSWNSPKMSVTECRSSATCSAMRMAWTMVLIGRPAPDRAR